METCLLSFSPVVLSVAIIGLYLAAFYIELLDAIPAENPASGNLGEESFPPISQDNNVSKL